MRRCATAVPAGRRAIEAIALGLSGVKAAAAAAAARPIHWATGLIWLVLIGDGRHVAHHLKSSRLGLPQIRL